MKANELRIDLTFVTESRLASAKKIIKRDFLTYIYTRTDVNIHD